MKDHYAIGLYIVTLVAIGLKAVGAISLSWWVVTAPIWVPLAFMVLISVMIVVLITLSLIICGIRILLS